MKIEDDCLASYLLPLTSTIFHPPSSISYLPSTIYHLLSPIFYLLLLTACASAGEIQPAAANGSFTPTVLTAPVSSLPTPGPTSRDSADLVRLARPPLPANPTQADYGAQIYYESCMACHGDHGQGLTDEWRAAWNPVDQNCWQSKCHASNHPQEGFKLPRQIPPVIGPGTLARFETAADLYTFISAKMPWQAPGLFDETQYWQLTAYLLRANGLPREDTTPLGPDNAAQIKLTIIRK